MYLTGGLHKGRKILVPDNTKPTLSKVRQSVFNILNQYDLEGKKFLDMFAGSAIMGLEALSRGYSVKELELNKKTAEIIKKNYENLNLKPDITICNALKYDKETFDIIYCDPPWDSDYTLVIKKACELINPKGIIIVEHDKIRGLNIKELINLNNFGVEIIKSKKYGRCMIDFLR